MAHAFPRDVPDVLPERLAARPVHPKMGLPIPAFADLSFTGGKGYNLNAVVPEAITLFAERRWCWICADPIPESQDVWFLSDEFSFDSGYYPEAGGHEECMLAALRLCPYIFNQRYQRATEKRLGHPQILDDPTKPVVWVLASSRYYKVNKGPRDGVYPRALRNARYFGYLNEALVELDLDLANQHLKGAGLSPIDG